MKTVTILALLKRLQDKVAGIERTPGPQGIDGARGEKGDSVKGEKGDRGEMGIGRDGRDGDEGARGASGEDGVGITDITQAADNSFVFTLSNGEEISIDWPLTDTATERVEIRQGGGGGGMTKSMNPVDNLRSYSFEIDSTNDVLTLAKDTCRTFFVISTPTNRDLRVWVGPLAPPADVTDWFEISTGYEFCDGVLGPIYIAESTRQDSTVYIMSSVDETDNASVGPLVDGANVCNITDDSGNLLTDASGNFIVTPA